MPSYPPPFAGRFLPLIEAVGTNLPIPVKLEP